MLQRHANTRDKILAAFPEFGELLKIHEAVDQGDEVSFIVSCSNQHGLMAEGFLRVQFQYNTFEIHSIWLGFVTPERAKIDRPLSGIRLSWPGVNGSHEIGSCIDVIRAAKERQTNPDSFVRNVMLCFNQLRARMRVEMHISNLLGYERSPQGVTSTAYNPVTADSYFSSFIHLEGMPQLGFRVTALPNGEYTIGVELIRPFLTATFPGQRLLENQAPVRRAFNTDDKFISSARRVSTGRNRLTISDMCQRLVYELSYRLVCRGTAVTFEEFRDGIKAISELSEKLTYGTIKLRGQLNDAVRDLSGSLELGPKFDISQAYRDGFTTPL